MSNNPKPPLKYTDYLREHALWIQTKTSELSYDLVIRDCVHFYVQYLSIIGGYREVINKIYFDVQTKIRYGYQSQTCTTQFLEGLNELMDSITENLK